MIYKKAALNEHFIKLALTMNHSPNMLSPAPSPHYKDDTEVK